MNSSLESVIDSALCRANEAVLQEENGLGAKIEVGRALKPIFHYLGTDSGPTVADSLTRRIGGMRLGVCASLMRESVEDAGAPLVPMVTRLLAATIKHLGWEGHGWLQQIPPRTTPTTQSAHCALVNTLMIVAADWLEAEIAALLPVLRCGEEHVRRAAWVVLRCWAWQTKALPKAIADMLPEAMNDSDPIVAHHANEMAIPRNIKATS